MLNFLLYPYLCALITYFPRQVLNSGSWYIYSGKLCCQFVATASSLNMLNMIYFINNYFHFLSGVIFIQNQIFYQLITFLP